MRTAPDSLDDEVHSWRGVTLSRWAAGRSTVVDVLETRARTRGGAPYLTGRGAGDLVETVTYGEMHRRSGRVAHWAAGAFGLHGGAKVALVLGNDIESVGVLFGLLRLGCTIVVLSPTDPPARRALHASGASAVVTLHSAALSNVVGDGLEVPESSRLQDRSRALPPVGCLDDALVLATSGSTAASKMVVQSHANVVANAEALRRHHRLGPSDRFLGCLPVCHVNGLHFTLMATLFAGTHAILAGRFDPLEYPRLLRRHEPSIASVVPTILESLLVTWRAEAVPASFRYFVSAAAPLDARTVDGVRRVLKARVVQGYGLTETTNFSTTCSADRTEEAPTNGAPSIGSALWGNDVVVLRADGDLAELDEEGEIATRGYNVMTRYEHDAAATADAFRGGWFHSGDLGRARRTGGSSPDRLWVTGRMRNVAKVGGTAVSLDEMDRVLREVPGVRDACCITVADRLRGELVVAAVAASDNVSDSILRAHLATIFPSAVVPDRFCRLEAVPRTATGKVRRAEISERLVSAERGDA